MSEDLISKKLAILVSEGNNIGKKLYESGSGYYHYNKDYYQSIERWIGSTKNLLKLRFGINSDYYKDFIKNTTDENKYKFDKETVLLATGVLEYIKDAYDNGLTDDLFYKKEIIVLSDLLDQAYEFLDKGFNLVAGIYGRIVMETTIREYALLYNIEDNKFDQLIIKLRKKGIIQKPFENSLRSNYEIGSWAAHGKNNYNNLKPNEIKEFLNFIRDKILTL
jgi:hypothetical protein